MGETRRCKWNIYVCCTSLLTPCSRVLLEKLTRLQLVKKFPAFYGTRRFITAFTSARHLSLSSASSIQSIPPHLTFWKSILILSSLLRVGLPSGLFPSGFPTQTLYTPSHHTCYMPRPSHSSRLHHSNNIGRRFVYCTGYLIKQGEKFTGTYFLLGKCRLCNFFRTRKQGR